MATFARTSVVNFGGAQFAFAANGANETGGSAPCVPVTSDDAYVPPPSAATPAEAFAQLYHPLTRQPIDANILTGDEYLTMGRETVAYVKGKTAEAIEKFDVAHAKKGKRRDALLNKLEAEMSREYEDPNGSVRFALDSTAKIGAWLACSGSANANMQLRIRHRGEDVSVGLMVRHDFVNIVAPLGHDYKALLERGIRQGTAPLFTATGSDDGYRAIRSPILGEMWRIVLSRAGDRGVSCKVDFDGERFLCANPDLMRITRELATNAGKYAATQVVIKYDLDRNAIVIMNDTKNDLPPDDKMFQSDSKGTHGNPDSTGNGLAHIKDVAWKNGWRLYHEREGAGVSFILRFGVADVFHFGLGEEIINFKQINDEYLRRAKSEILDEFLIVMYHLHEIPIDQRWRGLKGAGERLYKLMNSVRQLLVKIKFMDLDATLIDEINATIVDIDRKYSGLNHRLCFEEQWELAEYVGDSGVARLSDAKFRTKLVLNRGRRVGRF